MARGRIERQPRQFGIPSCPMGHGALLSWRPGVWHCSHTDHYGRPASHPLGALPGSAKFFTDEELSTQKEN